MTTKQSVGYHSIVALFSPSETRQSATIRAANVAAKLHSQVTLAHIAETSKAADKRADADSVRLNELTAEHSEIVQTKSAQGSLLEIVRLADEVSGDLIVLDSSVYGQLHPLLQESSETACDHGECDALVVHGNRGTAGANVVDYRHIVVAADLNDQGLMTIYKAVRMAKRYGARLTLLNVVDNFSDDKEKANAAKSLRLRGLEAFTSVIEGLKVEKEVVVTSDSVDQAVSAYSAQQQSDLVVIGSHNFHGLCVLLGSTAKHVIENGNCDVLVVHE